MVAEEKVGMVIGLYQVQPGDLWFLKKGKFVAWWFGGPRDGEALEREEFEKALRDCGVLTCRICGEKIFSGWVHVDIVYPEGLVFAEHGGRVGKPRVSV